MDKIVVATAKGGLDDEVCATFGRAPIFTVVDLEQGRIVHAAEKPNEYAEAARGAGIQAAQWVIHTGARAVIAGKYGPKASDVFSRSKVRMMECGEIKVRDALEQYIKGELVEAAPEGDSAPGWSHRDASDCEGGTNRGGRRAMGGGGRGGRGMGQGRGAGRGGGMGRGRGSCR